MAGVLQFSAFSETSLRSIPDSFEQVQPLKLRDSCNSVNIMSSDHELDELCDRALACRSEEEAFEIVERLRPYLRQEGLHTHI
jgi:hypothetical protein